jgi:cation transport regulator ChaC
LHGADFPLEDDALRQREMHFEIANVEQWLTVTLGGSRCIALLGDSGGHASFLQG